MAKSVTISAKITTTQKEDLEQMAKASNMTLNEYIKARLFHDVNTAQKEETVSDIEKRNYLTVCKIYALVQNLSLNAIKDPKAIEELERFAVDNVKNRGLLPSDHPLMVE